ncbi:hypothetical protein [Aeromonas veronii]|uniref:hypothetical protein n=1 Tax=Aeromonas veronii TaxID=654 RepID=UPI0024450ED3|nr:hypothetical protein [Aeromonas veronii]
MMLTTLNLHGKKYYYLLLHDQLGLAHWSLQQTELTRQLEHIASSQFWLHPASNTLCKIVPDKYPPLDSWLVVSRLAQQAADRPY